MASVGSPPSALRGRDATRGAAGRYGFVAEIARGYLGTLWVARDPSDPTATAFVRHVTPITAEATRSSLLEAARAAIVGGAETLEVHEAKTGVDIVSPFEDGEVLRTLLRTAALRHAAPAPEVLLGVAADIAAQLHDLHTAGHGSLAVFGGLHADSVFVATDGHVRMLDAGAAVVASGLEPWRSDPQRVGYFAPEQIEAKGTLDARTDVFALGILLWEAFANRRLFPGNDARSARERVLRAPIPRLDATQKSATPGVPTAIADLIATALSRDPAGRFQSMGEMSDALGSLERAAAAAIGEWVSGLAGSVIEKRRHMLERTGASHSAAQVAQTLAQSPSMAPPASVAPPSVASPSVAPPSVAPTPTPPAVAAPVPGVSATPKPPMATATPRPPGASPAPGPAAATPSASAALDAFFASEPPPGSPVEQAPGPERESMSDSVAPEPPASSSGLPSPGPVPVTSAAAEPGFATAANEVDPQAPDSAPRARADSEEAIDVGDSDLATSDAPPPRKSTPPPPPPPSLKRPPKLPGAAAASPTGGHAEEEDILGGQHSPSLAAPVGVSQLGALTQKPVESRVPWVVGAVAALLLGIGGIFLLKGGGREPVAPEPASKDEPRNPIPTGEVPPPHAPEPVEQPAASAAPAPVAVPPVEVGASPTIAEPKAEPPREEPAKVEPPKPEAPAASPKPAAPPAEKPKPAAREPSPTRPRSTTETGTHRPPASRSTPGSTYKPGGI